MFKILQTINIGKENPVLTYEQPFERGDKNAHTWEVRVYDKNNMPVDLTGMNVIAYFSPRELEKSFSVHGTIESNVAKVTLDEKCYAVSGRLTGVLQVSNVDDIVTMAIAQFRVREDINEQIVETGDPINNVQDLLAQIEAMKSATKAATDAAYQANLGTEAANAAAEAANASAGTAGLAANAANNSASLANSAASNADEAAKRANTAAETIETATGAADEAAQAANQAAERANAAAAVVDENLEKVELNISEAGNVQIAAIQAAGAAQTQAVNSAGAAQLSAIENKAANALASIPEDYTKLDRTVKSLKDFKADAIIDTSARAAAHELHAQAGPMSVTLFGKTTETGTGDKSPDNPYVISGVDGAVHCGSKNLLKSGIMWNRDNGSNFELGSGGTNTTRIRSESFYFPFIGTFTLSGLPSGYSFIAIRTYNKNKKLIADSVRPVYFSFTISRSDVRYIHLLFGGTDLTENNITELEAANIQIERGSAATAYEPYNANVITPPLLPLNADGTGEPLYGNGTVDDIVENDVPSGCDKKIVLDGTTEIQEATFTMANGGKPFYVKLPEDIGTPLPATAYGNNMLRVEMITASSAHTYPCFAQHSDGEYIRVYVPGVSDIATYLAANPLTVYYRSTEYTPEKDLRVCRVERYWINETLDGTESYGQADVVGQDGYYFFRNGNKKGISDASSILCESLKSAKEFSASAGGSANIICNANSTAAPRFYLTHELLGTNKDMTSAECLAAAKEWLVNNPIHLVRRLATPEVYMTDRQELRKPYGIMPVTVTGSGETAVEYPHDTKHYIDSKISELVTLALANQ